MKENFCVGDVVVSVSGRDKGNCFLIVKVYENFSFLVDGRLRKVDNPKKKNNKHINLVLSQGNVPVAEKIRKGVATSNGNLYKWLKGFSQKIGGVV